MWKLICKIWADLVLISRNLFDLETTFDLNSVSTTRRIINIVFLFCLVNVIFLYSVKIFYPFDSPDVSYIKSKEIFRMTLECAAYAMIIFFSANFTTEKDEKVKFIYCWNILLSFFSLIIIVLLFFHVASNAYYLLNNTSSYLFVGVHSVIEYMIYPFCSLLVLIHFRLKHYSSYWNYIGFITISLSLGTLVPVISQNLENYYMINTTASTQVSIDNIFKMLDNLLPI